MEITLKAQKKLYKSIYRKSYYQFYKDAFKILHPSEVYDENWHAEYLCNILQSEAERIKKRIQKDKDIIINMPFRSSKSLITTVIFNAWCWTWFPEMKFICVSYAEDLALEHAQMCRSLINSEWYQEYWSNSFDWDRTESGKGFYRNSKGGFRKSVGTGGQITGSGSDISITDDAQNPKKAASEAERKNTKDFWDHTLYSRLNNPELGVRINVQQRLHQEDLTGHLLDKDSDSYFHICLPAKITDKATVKPKELEENYVDGLFWHTRFNEKVLQQFVKSLGSTQAANQLQQLPSPEEGSIFKRDWFTLVDPVTLSRDIFDQPIQFYLDTAETEKQTGDYTAILACYKQNNQIWIADVRAVKMEFYELCKWIIRYVEENRYSQDSRIKIEPKSSGKSVVSQLRNTTELNVQEIKQKGKGRMDDKITRAHACQPILESRRVNLLKGNYITDFLDQVTTFPNAANDDMVDVLIYAIDDLLNDSGFDFAFV